MIELFSAITIVKQSSQRLSALQDTVADHMGALRREEHSCSKGHPSDPVRNFSEQEGTGVKREKGKGNARDSIRDGRRTERRFVAEGPRLDKQDPGVGRESRGELLRALPETAPGNIAEPDDVPAGTPVRRREAHRIRVRGAQSRVKT